MKKKYEKPQVLMENFELSQHIATCDYQGDKSGLNLQDIKNCVVKVYFTSKNVCDPDDGKKGPGEFVDGAPVFINGNTNCMTEFEGVCYTTGPGGQHIYAS